MDKSTPYLRFSYQLPWSQLPWWRLLVPREQRFPDVVAVEVHARAPDRSDLDVTVASPYDTAQRYADALRVTGRDGKLYGERTLLHDHAEEQPFTRDLDGVTIPTGVKLVTVQARDQKYGYGGKAVEVMLPGR